MSDAVTLASFEAGVQEKAAASFQRFLEIYHLPASTVRPAELGAAVRRALDEAAGDADRAAFEATLSTELLRVVHKRMGERSARGEDLQTGLDAAAYQKLRRSLEQRFGPLPKRGEGDGAHRLYVYLATETQTGRTFEIAVQGPWIDDTTDVTSGPLDGDLVDGVLHALASGRTTAVETTNGSKAISVGDTERILASGVAIAVEGPIAIR
jgi:hypothetical protein